MEHNWATILFFFLRYLFVSEILKLSLITLNWASLVAQMVKNLPVMQETQIWSLGWEDPLEKEMAAQSSILAWRIPWREEPGGLQYIGSQRVRHDWSDLAAAEAAAERRLGFPGGTSGKEPTCQLKRLKRLGLDPWLGRFSWRSAWQPTPGFLPAEESHGQRNLVGCSPWGC